MKAAPNREGGGRWAFRLAAGLYAIWLLALAARAIAHKFG
jgi:hypothetical protein